MSNAVTVERCPHCTAAHQYELLVTRGPAAGKGGMVMRTRLFICPVTGVAFEHRFALVSAPGEQIVEVRVAGPQDAEPEPAADKVSRVFVSYSRADETVIVPIVSIMRAAGSSVFRDGDSIPYGKRWRPIIERSIHDAMVVIVFWCEHARASEEVSREWRLAIEIGINVVPALLDDTPLHPDLAPYQGVDLRTLAVGHVARQRRMRRLLEETTRRAAATAAAERLMEALSRTAK